LFDITVCSPTFFVPHSEARAILGLRAFPNFALLLIATKVRCDVALYGGHEIFTIEERQWIRIPLSYFQSLPKNECKTIETVIDFPLEGLSYYSETIDLTRTFPSYHNVHDCDAEFRWNTYWSASFEEAGFKEVCVVLLQGLAIGRTIQSNERDSKPGKRERERERER
jgi:hypothetical protein